MASSSGYLSDLGRKKRACEDDIAALEQQLKEVERKIAEERARQGFDELDEGMILDIARKRFNNSPNAGIKFLNEHKYFDGGGTAVEVAQWLYDEVSQDTVQKGPLGEYLGDGKSFNIEVLGAFSCCHKFDGMSFDAALRAYLWSFRLPGESQKIDRMMETFAERFMACVPGVFATQDACYILSFATIMLNTSLHNPAASPTSFELFCSMNRGINDGEDFSPSFLGSLYESIKNVPFKIPEDELGIGYSFMNPDKQGWVRKEGGTVKSWTKRWLVVTNGCLYYFKSKDDSSPLGIIPLVELTVSKVNSFITKKSAPIHAFELKGKQAPDGSFLKIKGCKTNAKGVVVEGNHTRYIFRVDSENEVQDWIRCVKTNLSNDSAFANLYRAKRAGSSAFAMVPGSPGGVQ